MPKRVSVRSVQRRVEFLGHRIDENGLHMMTEKLDAIRDWPPSNQS